MESPAGDSKSASVPILQFSTLDFPVRDRFDAWVKESHCDGKLNGSDETSFDAAARGAALGPFILSGRQWLNRKQRTTYQLARTEARIRADGQDFYRFTLPLFGKFLWRSEAFEQTKSVGDLFFLDAARPLECAVDTGDVISLVVPRDLLPPDAALLHGATLTGGVGRLLADHLLSLFQNLPRMMQHELPHIVQATHQLLIAAVSQNEDANRAAIGPIQHALMARVQRYIEAHLLEPDLNPDRISRDVGISRAKLYQLFESSGGVMHQIQHRRLRQAYRFLSDPGRPHALIAEIAWRHGFPNEKYFHRLFKAEFGHTPHETVKKSLDFNSLSKAGTLVQPPDGKIIPIGWALPYGVPTS